MIFSLEPLVYIAKMILTVVFEFVFFNLFGLVTVPFILILGLDDIFP
jgi:hypothetical protein